MSTVALPFSCAPHGREDAACHPPSPAQVGGPLSRGQHGECRRQAACAHRGPFAANTVACADSTVKENACRSFADPRDSLGTGSPRPGGSGGLTLRHSSTGDHRPFNRHETGTPEDVSHADPDSDSEE